MRLMNLRSFRPIIKSLDPKISSKRAFAAFVAVAIAAAIPRAWAEDAGGAVRAASSESAGHRADSRNNSSLIGDLLGSDQLEGSAASGFASQDDPRGNRDSGKNDVLIGGDDSSLFQAQFAHAVFPESYDVELPPAPNSSARGESGPPSPSSTKMPSATPEVENDILNAEELFRLLFPNGTGAQEETEPSIESAPSPASRPSVPLVPAQAPEPFAINQSGASSIALALGLDARRARMIVQYRDVHGPFRSPEDLQLVTGINDSHILRWEEMGLLNFD